MRIKRISNGVTSFPGEYVFPPRSEDDRCVDDDLDEHPRVPRSARLTNHQTSPVRAPPSFLALRITSRDDSFHRGVVLGITTRGSVSTDLRWRQRRILVSTKSTVKPSLGNDDFTDDVRENNRARVLPRRAEFMFT